MSKISVIVPIYNALDALKVLLASLLKNFNFELGEILLINDYSNQETSEYLTQFVNEHSKFKLFNNEKNLGFVKTCNKGMQLASGDIIVLLNSDTEIPSNFCEQIIKCFESDSKIGIASPISSHSWLFYIPLPKNYSLEKMNSKLRQKHKCSYPLIHAAEGFCFCIRKKVIEKQGYLDEIYGKGYKEEVDFAYRAISNGWKNVLIDNLYVYHKRHASFGVEQREILLKQNDTVYRQRWKGFKENYEKENNLINPVIKIEQEMFPFRTFFFKKKIKKGCSYNFFEELFSIKNSKDKRHKIISILGIKLSLANQKPKIIYKFSNINHCDWDLFVTYVDENEKSKNKILKIKPDTKFIKVKNAGYDILPFLKIIENVNLSEYDYILKMHTKNYRAKPYIGVGYDDGISKDLPVINAEGLIGFISKTSKNVSEVKLLTSINENNLRSVLIETNDGVVAGMLSDYSVKNGLFKITDVTSKASVLAGDSVVLSGYDNESYKGIYVGKVVKEESDNYGLSRTIWVESSVNFDDLMYVLVPVVKEEK